MIGVMRIWAIGYGMGRLTELDCLPARRAAQNFLAGAQRLQPFEKSRFGRENPRYSKKIQGSKSSK
jgi:hypothetical protein